MLSTQDTLVFLRVHSISKPCTINRLDSLAHEFNHSPSSQSERSIGHTARLAGGTNCR